MEKLEADLRDHLIAATQDKDYSDDQLLSMVGSFVKNWAPWGDGAQAQTDETPQGSDGAKPNQGDLGVDPSGGWDDTPASGAEQYKLPKDLGVSSKGGWDDTSPPGTNWHLAGKPLEYAPHGAPVATQGNVGINADTPDMGAAAIDTRAAGPITGGTSSGGESNVGHARRSGLSDDSEWNDVKAQISAFEGPKRYLYADTVGKVTTGIGQMLPTVEEAAKLPFKHAGTGLPATRDEIKNAFNAVLKSYKDATAKKGTAGSNSAVPAAGHYEGLSDLELDNSEVEKRFESALRSTYGALRKTLKDFDDMPPDAQKALLDMGYNVGVPKLPLKFPSFINAVRRGDWAAAAKESHRKKISDERNQYVHDLFDGLAQRESNEDE